MLSLLAILYASVLLAGFLAPYAPAEQNRDRPFAPPTRLHFAEATGKLHLRPFVYRLVSQPGGFGDYGEDRSTRYPMRFLVRGASYRIAGMAGCNRHLFGFDAPARGSCSAATSTDGASSRACCTADRSRSGPLITINCAGVPDTLLESELFSHVRGSFTDAYRDKHGEIQRVGSGSDQAPIDVRVIASTNRDLMGRIATKEFREDLYYRLNVIHLTIHRSGNGRRMCRRCSRISCGSAASRIVFQSRRFRPRPWRRFLTYHWPGNVRELRNVETDDCKRLLNFLRKYKCHMPFQRFRCRPVPSHGTESERAAAADAEPLKVAL